MSLPDKLYFMPADHEDEPGIEIGDGRVLLLHPFGLNDDNVEDARYVNALYRAIVHRYNNFERTLGLLQRAVDTCDRCGGSGREREDVEAGPCPTCLGTRELLEKLEEVCTSIN